MKLSILKLFSRIGGYSVLPDLLIGTIDDNESIRNQARIYVQKWKNEAVNMFRAPNEAEKDSVLKVYNYVNEIHLEKKYFKANPLEGLYFYIK